MPRYRFHARITAADGQWRRSFEEAYAALEQLPRIYLEPDGSFFQVIIDEPRGRLDGNLYDGGGRLQHIELKADCSIEAFDILMTAIGGDDQPLRFELIREGLILDEVAFRNYVTVD